MSKTSAMPVTQKGQVTIPKQIRDFLQIKPQSRVYFEIENDQVVVKPSMTVEKLWQNLPASKGYASDESIQETLKQRYK